MTNIKRQNPKQSIISFPDFDIRLFVKYDKGFANEIRIWKLPVNSNFLHMFNSKNLIWAIYNQDAKYLHGWFSKEGDFTSLLTKKIAECSNLQELEEQLMDFERVIRKHNDNETMSEEDKEELKEFVRSAATHELLNKEVEFYMKKDVDKLKMLAPYNKAAKTALEIKSK